MRYFASLPQMTIRVLAALFLSGCVTVTPTATPYPTQVPYPIATPYPTQTSRPTPTPITPTPTHIPPTSTPSLIYQDDFGSNSKGWRLNSKSDPKGEIKDEITEGQLRITARCNAGSRGMCFYEPIWIPGFSAKDFLFSIDVTVLDSYASPGNVEIGFGLRCWGVFCIESSFYNDATFAVHTPLPSPRDLAPRRNNPSIKLNKGVTNNFSVLVQGSQFTMYANGNELATATNTDLGNAGGALLWVRLSGEAQQIQYVTIAFDDLSFKTTP